MRRFKREHHQLEMESSSSSPYALSAGGDAVVLTDVGRPVEEVLDEMAEEEIDEVNIIMEDISEEIKDLQVRERNG